MSLTLALNTALQSLNVNQKALATLSQNIANANNPDYSRKVITQEAVYIQGQGAGVQITNIGRTVDTYLQKSVRDQGSVYGQASVADNYSDQLQTLLGSPGSSNSIYSYITNFFNSAQSLSETPENASLRVGMVSAAQTVATQMNSLATGIYGMQYNADQDIKTSIDSVNQDLQNIYSLNADISGNKLLGRPTSELEDKRDALLNDVSQYIDIQTYQQSDGVMNVFTAGGYSLVDQNVYALSYNPASSPDFFANNNSTSPINIYRLDANGNKVGTPSVLATSGSGSQVTTALTTGKIKGLLDVRDKQLPDVLAKLDMLASTMRDTVNAVNNTGVAYPGAASYTGTRLLNAQDYSQWSGSIRIAVLDQNGQPVPSNYNDETSGIRPLDIDLSKLDTGNGPGNPSVQGIIDEINRNYGVPQNKVELGNLNNISLVLNNQTIPGSTPQLNFDFKLDNISGSNSDFYVTGVQVLDDNNNDITSVTQDVPKQALASTGTYTTTAGSGTVTVKTNGPTTYHNGDVIYLSPPATAVDGLPSGALGGYFTISNVTGNSFDIATGGAATAGGSFDRAGVESRPAYATSQTGTDARTTDSGTIITSLAGNTTSKYYTVKANVAVKNADGTISTSTVTYKINNQQFNVQNYPYAATSASDAGKIVVPNTSVPTMTAKLVDANGNELPIVNNQYSTAVQGYLQLSSPNGNYVIAVDSLDSTEQGQPNSNPPVAATNRGFSHYFELNNFFTTNRTTGVVDNVAKSAANMAVSKSLIQNANLIALGKLEQSPAPSDPSKPPLYTYVRNQGDNSVISALAKFGTSVVSFGAAGDLGNTSSSLSAYAGQMVSTVSTKATANKSDSDNAKLLLDGFTERSDGVRGVNLDEELANTIIYQNAYTASARIITVANEFFQSLMDAVK